LRWIVVITIEPIGTIRPAVIVAEFVTPFFVAVWHGSTKLAAIARWSCFLRCHHRGALTIAIASPIPALGVGRRAGAVAPFEPWSIAGHRTSGNERSPRPCLGRTVERPVVPARTLALRGRISAAEALFGSIVALTRSVVAGAGIIEFSTRSVVTLRWTVGRPGLPLILKTPVGAMLGAMPAAAVAVALVRAKIATRTTPSVIATICISIAAIFAGAALFAWSLVAGFCVSA